MPVTLSISITLMSVLTVGSKLLADLLEVSEQFAHGLIALVAILAKSLLDKQLNVVWNKSYRFAERPRFFMKDRPDNVDVVLAHERKPARHHLVQHRAEAEDVRPGINKLPPGLLGRHICDSAHHESGMRLYIRN